MHTFTFMEEYFLVKISCDVSGMGRGMPLEDKMTDFMDSEISST
jgi:hypothetical protein